MTKFIVYSTMISLIIIFGISPSFVNIGHFYNFFKLNDVGKKTNILGKEGSELQIQTVVNSFPIASAEISTKPLDIKIKNITADNATDNNESNLHIAFNITNPNQNSMLLEGLNYDLYSKNHHIISGSIGNPVINDVFQSQAEFPILGKSSLSFKDIKTIQKSENIDNNLFNDIVKGHASYLVNGTLFYRQTTDIQDTGGIQQFKHVFP